MQMSATKRDMHAGPRSTCSSGADFTLLGYCQPARIVCTYDKAGTEHVRRTGGRLTCRYWTYCLSTITVGIACCSIRIGPLGRPTTTPNVTL